MFSRSILPVLLASALGVPTSIHAAEAERPPVAGLISRFAPTHAQQFVTEDIPAVDGRDAYEVESAAGKFVLRGSSGVAKASAFYHYLKEFCNAHQPWQFMQNIEGVLPPSQSIIDQRAKLGRFIVERCQSMGIEPVLQGYYGMLPTGFAKKHPDAKIIPQPTWNSGYRRPDMLDPSDPLFAPIAKSFMEEGFGEAEKTKIPKA